MSIDSGLLDAITTLATSAFRLPTLGFARQDVDQLQALAAVVAYRRILGAQRWPLIGFIGCTGVGKSTLFNSLCQYPLSVTGWQVHNTRGPVLFMPQPALACLEAGERQHHGRLLLPAMQRVNIALPTGSDATVGQPDALCLFSPPQSHAAVETCCLIDLPDINSAPAMDEKLVALEILPWLDVVVFMVDDETVYHRVFDQPVQLADRLGQRRLCIMVHRGRDRIDTQHPDWRRTCAFFGVDQIHVLSDLKQKAGYTHEPEYLAIKHALGGKQAAAISSAMVGRIAAAARAVSRENRQRRQSLDGLDKTAAQAVHDLLAQDTPLALRRIMPDQTLHALNHLGLKRFALSNLLYFFKNTAKTGALRQSAKLAFGTKQDESLSQMLRIDRQKLNLAVTERWQEYEQYLTSALRRSPEFDTLKAVATAVNCPMPGLAAAAACPDALAGELDMIAQSFEDRCHQLISDDSVSRVLQNDPLAVFFLIGALVADIFALPGFGSWILIPTVVKYLPMGKFEATKNKFQHAVQDLIRRQLLDATGPLRQIRQQALLADDDPLLQALESCARSGHHTPDAAR